MTIGLQTGMQTRCPYRFANRSSCVNGQIHCLQTGRRPDRKNQTYRKNQTCLILAIAYTYYGMGTVNRIQAFEWYRFQRPRVTSNPDFKVTINRNSVCYFCQLNSTCACVYGIPNLVQIGWGLPE